MMFLLEPNAENMSAAPFSASDCFAFKRSEAPFFPSRGVGSGGRCKAWSLSALGGLTAALLVVESQPSSLMQLPEDTNLLPPAIEDSLLRSIKPGRRTAAKKAPPVHSTKLCQALRSSKASLQNRARQNTQFVSVFG